VKKGLEYLLQSHRIHAAAGIFDDELNKISRSSTMVSGGGGVDGNACRGDCEQTAARHHRVAGVGAEIGDDLLDHGRIGFNPHRLRGATKFEVHAFVQQAAQEDQEMVNHLIEIDDFDLNYLAAAECQELLREAGCAMRHIFQFCERGLDSRRPVWAGRNEADLDKHRGENVIEIVCDATASCPTASIFRA